MVGKPFPAGASGNPKGRPKGSRNKLSESLLSAFCSDFEMNGVKAIEVVRREDPSTYLRVAAQLIPKEIDATIDSRVRVIADRPMNPEDWAKAFAGEVIEE